LSEKTVVFLIASGYSGSTLLTHFLGAHSNILNLGEILEGFKNNPDCKCAYCEKACPVWGSVISNSTLSNHVRSFNFQNTGKFRSIKRLASSGYAVLSPSSKPGFIFNKVFEADQEISVIIDGSKNLKWTKWQMNNSSFKAKFIFLVRDIRALSASRIRKLPENLSDAVSLLVRRLKTFNNFYEKLPEADKILIRYEELVSNPDGIGKRITDFLDLRFENSMLDYSTSRHHILGGSMTIMMKIKEQYGQDSSAYKFAGKEYYKGSGSFFLDERWKTDLGEDDISEIMEMGEQINSKFGYT
jgi:Sulfotransferase family